jgi:TolB-like protein
VAIGLLGLIACNSTKEAEEPVRPPGIDEPEHGGAEGGDEVSHTGADANETAEHSTPANKIQAALASLASKAPVSPYRVAIANFSYGETGVAGDFSGYITSELSFALGQVEALNEFARKQLDQVLAEQKLSLSDLIDQKDVPEVGSLKGVQGLILGTYTADDDAVYVSLQLLHVESGEVLSSARANLDKSTLPKRMRIEPRELGRTKEAIASFASGRKLGDFSIKVWPDHGAGGVYRVGELLKVKFESDVDCYVRLFHLSADDELQMIYPNQWSGPTGRVKAGEVHTIPPDGRSKFTMEPPYGAEVIYAVASSLPFTGEEEAFKILGGTQDIGHVKTRGLKVSGGSVQMADATCTYTIIE